MHGATVGDAAGRVAVIRLAGKKRKCMHDSSEIAEIVSAFLISRRRRGHTKPF